MMRQTIRRIYLHFKYSPIFIYLAGILAAYITEQILAEFNRQWGLIPTAVAALAILIGLWFLYQMGLWVFHRFLTPDPIPMGDKPEPHRALLLLLGGKSRDTGPIAIKHHLPNLERIWFIVTDFTEPISDELKQQYSDISCLPVKILHHYRPEHAASAVRQAIDYARAMDISPDEIICDVTGGTSAMTAGVIQACLNHDIELQMVAARYNPETGEVLQAHDVIRLEMG